MTSTTANQDDVSRAIERSQDLQRAIVTNSPDFILVTDLDGRIEFINQTLPELSVEHACGRLLTDYLRPEEHARVHACLDHVRETRQSDRYETSYERCNGETMYFESHVSPLGDQHEVTAFVVISRDVTRQRRAMHQLRQHEQMLEHAQQVAHIGSWHMDLSGEHRDMVLSCEAQRILGVGRGEGAAAFVGSLESFVQYVHPDDRQTVTAILQECIEHPDAASFDHRVAPPDGSMRWVHQQIMPVRDAHDRVQLMGVAQDITERQRATEATRRIVEGVSSSVGEQFFLTLVRCLAEATGVRHAVVARLDENNPMKSRSIAVWSDGKVADNFSRDLHDTPCAQARGRKICMFPQGVTEQFPKDTMIADMGVTAYGGAALLNSKQEMIGMLVVMDDKPFEDVELIDSLLRIFAVRAATELEAEETYQALRASEERYRTFIANSSEAIWRYEFDPPVSTALPVAEQVEAIMQRARVAECNDAYARTLGFEHAADVIGMLHSTLTQSPADDPCHALESFIAGGYRLADIESAEHSLDGEPRYLHKNLQGVIEKGQLVRIWGTHRDITERKRNEQRQRLLMRELDHRVKNNLAAVMSLAQQSLHGSVDVDEFASALMGRIGVMARTHETLARANWNNVALDSVVKTALAAFLTDEQIEQTLEDEAGRPVLLGSRAAMPLCMTIHELATNAVKHGALAHAEGRLLITWKLTDADVQLEWLETRADAADVSSVWAQPEPGLGTQLIQGLISHELAGSVDLDFTPTGLRCRLTIPLDRAGDNGEPPA